MTFRAARHRRTAFSLLEVILAIALSVIIVYLVFSAIDFHLRLLTVHKTGIEEAQLARAILRRVSDDLRAVVVNRPIDMSSVSQLSTATTSGTSGTSGTSQGGGSQPNSDPAADDDDATAGLPTTPGVYGNAYELQIDISQIPRYEEYANLAQNQNTQQLQMLSDVKTVSYFLLGQTGLGTNSSTNTNSSSRLAGANSSLLQAQAVSLGFPPDQPLRGLGRRVVDRAAVRYATQGANSSFLDQYVELMAPEVLLLQFRYFDGQQWLYEWNTELLGGIPLAIEIVLVLRPSDEKIDETSLASSQESLQDMLWQHDPNHVYRLVVNLPLAEMIDTTAASDTDTSDQDDGGSGR